MSTITAIAWTPDATEPKSVRLVCIGYANRSAAEDHVAEPDEYLAPMLWPRKNRHASTPVYIMEVEP
jgi:hypothetical protein